MFAIQIICLPIVSLFSLILLHIAYVRWLIYRKKEFSQQSTLIRLSLSLNVPLGIVLLIICLTGNFDQGVSSFIYIFLVYNALSYSYFHVFNMSETARRIRLLLEIRLNRDVELKYKNYSEINMIKSRIERLIHMGQIKSYGSIFKVNSNFLINISNLVNLWKKILNLEEPS